MDLKLRAFLGPRRSRKDYHTHVSMISLTGTFEVDAENIDEFWAIYCAQLREHGGAFMAGIAESPSEFLPVVADVDIKIKLTLADAKNPNLKVPPALYTPDQMRTVVGIYQSQLRTIVRDYTPVRGTCVVLEKSAPTVSRTDQVIKHGFHLHFPYVVMNRVDQDVHLIPRVRAEMKQRGVFQSLGIDSESTIDRNCTNTHWLMYGSRKRPDLKAYLVTRVYDDTLAEMSMVDAFRPMQLRSQSGTPIPLDTEDRVRFHLPRILSMHVAERDSCVTAVRPDLVCALPPNCKPARECRSSMEGRPVEEVLEKASKLLTMISPARAEPHNDRMEIGWTLFNIGNGCQEAYQLWVDFCKQCPQEFSEAVCASRWSKMTVRNKTLGTLHFYAKLDSPQQYAEYVRKCDKGLANKILSGGHFDVARMVYHRFPEEFIWVPFVKREHSWYRFEGHRWVKDGGAVSLRNKLTGEILVFFESQLKKELDRCRDRNETKSSRVANIGRIIGNLKNNSFEKSVVSQCEKLYSGEPFLDKINSNPNLLHFTNGVLDLEEKGFRPGRPADLITMTTRYEWKEYTEDSPEVMEVHEMLTQFFPDPDLKQFYLQWAAGVLTGGAARKKLVIHQGPTDAGKSVCMSMLEGALGDHCRVLPTSAITGKRTQSSAATPEFQNAEGMRLYVLQEPGKTEEINVGFVKELTSGKDKMYFRDLFSDGRVTELMATICMVCNHLPRLPYDDPAFWNRCLVLPYESYFPEHDYEVPATLEDQIAKKTFRRDPRINEKLARLRPAFMWVLVRTHYQLLISGPADVPEKAKIATKTYRMHQDCMYQFISESVVEDRDQKCSITLNEMYHQFEYWVAHEHKELDKRNIPTKLDMMDYLVEKWGKPADKSRWVHRRFRTDKDDADIVDGQFLSAEGPAPDPASPHIISDRNRSVALTF